MNAPLSREDWIDFRVTELLSNSHDVASLVEDIQAQGGQMHANFCRHIAAWYCGESAAIRESAADQVATVISAFAFIRAVREYDGRPLVP